MNRRDFVSASSTLAGGALAGAATIGPSLSANAAQIETVAARNTNTYRRIGTEEAWSIPEQMNNFAQLSRSVWSNLDVGLWRGPSMHRGKHASVGGALGQRLIDTEQMRLGQMNELGIDMHVLSLTSPGVQLLDPDDAVTLAALANDRMAEIVRNRPTRFGGLASFAPQDPKRAAKEMDRAINQLKLNGFIVNSSTDNQYLDDQKYWDIFEAAEALDAAIYIHPRCPSDGMAAPFRGYNMAAALWGFACETGTHAVRLMLSGVFDRFPNLKIVLGHLGENISYHLWRTDHWYLRFRHSFPSKQRPMDLFAKNFYITTSGAGAYGASDVSCAAALKYCIQTFGADRIMWAIDYPYEEMPPAVAFMNNVAISDADKHAIYHGTAERVFHIPAADPLFAAAG